MLEDSQVNELQMIAGGAAYAKAMPGNPYDGHTLATVIPEMENLIGNTIECILADAGYRGHNAPPDYKFRGYTAADASACVAMATGTPDCAEYASSAAESVLLGILNISAPAEVVINRLRCNGSLIVLESLNPDGTTPAEVLSLDGAWRVS
jgi:hypothetical protein